MPPIERRPTTRSEVAREYGYPWPWKRKDLVEEYAVEPGADIRDLADQWAVTRKRLHVWIRRHGFRTENHRVVR